VFRSAWFSGLLRFGIRIRQRTGLLLNYTDQHD
jgi:hypothetical protein